MRFGALLVPALVAVPPSDVTTLTYRTVVVAQQFVDTDPSGLSPGDRFVSASRLTPPGAGKAAGSESTDCVVVRVATPDDPYDDPYDDTAAGLQCTKTIDLPDGQVAAQGFVSTADRAPSLAVVGGTRSYAGASGTATITDLRQGEDPTDTAGLLTLHLIRPAAT